MRLLQIGENGQLTMTKELREAPAPYAILSHRWAEDDDKEVAFDNWDKDSSQSKPGYAKLIFCAAQAKRDSLKYFWVDTCCINRNNHVELNASIRSMFQWYQEAARCYVYLSDVVFGNKNDSHSPLQWKSDLQTSTWFKRGWTLQELLAPKVVEFFSKDCRYLGSKITLEEDIREITGIPVSALRGRPLSDFSVEQRWQWVEKRETKKIEDKAYCLFGIFGVFLPLMYGEKANAVKRLKEEIGITTGKVDGIIRDAYRGKRLEVERLSGKSLPLEDCFINLCMVNHQRNSDTKPDRRTEDARTDGQQQMSKFSLAARLKVETPPESNQIFLNTLFDVQKRKDGSQFRPHRVLIWGGAGMGKTTLCKKMVHDFYHYGLWKDLYDRIVWLPLRKLKLAEHEADDTVQLIKKEFFSVRTEKNLMETIQSKVILNPRTLFILDGLDEVSYSLDLDTSIGRVLENLLARSNIIVTSRPHSTGILDHIPPDLELETIGFYPQQIEEYIQHTVQQSKMPDETVTEIQSFIQSRPLLRSLARIPIQLDAICYSWNLKNFPRANITMTILYQTITDSLWAKDIVRLRKRSESSGELITMQQIQQSFDVRDFNKDENKVLEELAFFGLYNEIIEFDHADVKRHVTGQKILGDALVHLSFLRSSDNSLEAPDRTFHFLHLTFQEFFAARYFVRHWKTGSAFSDSCSRLNEVSTRPTELSKPEDFLKSEKYTSRYDIFWRFVTGLLGMETDRRPLYRLLRMIEEEPLDLIGLTHQRLIIHCLAELSCADGELQHEIQKREKRYVEWILCELRFSGEWSRTSLLRETECSDYILETLLRNMKTTAASLNMLSHRLSLSSKILDVIYETLNKEKDKRIRLAAVRFLGQQGHQIQEAKYLPFWNDMLESPGLNRSELATALNVSHNLHQTAIETLIRLHQDPEEDIRSEAAQALGSQSSLSSSAIEALIQLLQDPGKYVRSKAAQALCRQSSLSSSAIKALIQLLQDPEEDTRSQAAWVLGSQSSLSSSAIEALIQLLQDPGKYVRSQAAQALGGQSSLSSSAIKALIELLQHPEEDMQSSAVRALDKHEEFFTSIPSLNSLAIQNLLKSWFCEGSVTCFIWCGSLRFDIHGKQQKVALHNGQGAQIKTAWFKAQKALGLPVILPKSPVKHKDRTNTTKSSLRKQHRQNQ